MSPIYNTGGGAAASNSVAATKEETPAGTKIMRGEFNNDTGADDKRLSVSTTPRTTRSALSPISRYYCRRNWYIDINGYHQFQTSYDKIVINNKDNNNNNVTTPKQLERVPNNNNEEQEESKLNNKDVNTEFEVSITPETTSRKEGVLKVRDSSKSNTTSVATKKNTPTGQRETGGGVMNDTSTRKSIASIMTKSNLSALRNNDTAPRKEGVSPTGQREIGTRFNNDASMGNENSLSVTAPRTNLSSYIESNKRTPRKEGVPKERNSSKPHKDNNTPPRKEGVRDTTRNNNNKELNNIPTNNKTHRKEGMGFIWYEQVPRFDTNSWIPVTAGLGSINNRKIVMPSSRFVTPTHNAYAALSEDNDDGGSLYPPISVVKQKEIGMVPNVNINNNNNTYGHNNNNTIIPSEEEGVVPTTKERTNETKARTDDYNYDTLNNTVVPSEEGVVKNKDDTVVPSKEGVVKNKDDTHGHPFKNGVSKKQTNVRPNNTDDVRHKSSNNTNRNNNDNVDDTVFHPPDKDNNTIDPSKASGLLIEDAVLSEERALGNNNNTTNNSINPLKERVRVVNRIHDNDGERWGYREIALENDPSKEGVWIKKRRTNKFIQLSRATMPDTNKSAIVINNINPSKEGMRIVDNNHDNNTNGNPSKEGVRVISTNHDNTIGHPSKEGVRVINNNRDTNSDATPPGLRGLNKDDWSNTDSIDEESFYDDGEIGIRTNAINDNNVIQPVNKNTSKIGVSGKEQTNTNHVIGILIHEYNHNNDHFIGNIIHECNHNNENDDSDDDSDESSVEDNSDDESSDESSVEDSDDDGDFYIRTQCDWCYTNRCECNYPSDDSDDDTEDNDTDSDSESSEEEEDDSDGYNDTDYDCESYDDNELSVDLGSPENSAVVAATMYHESKAIYISSEEEEETDDEDSGVSYLSRGSTFYTYYGGEYFYDNSGDLHYCGQNDNEYDSDASDPGDNGIPDVISCSSNDDSSDDDDDNDSSYYESCNCEDPKCDCDAEMRYNQYKRKHQLENPELYELKFKLDNPTLFPRLHGYLQKVPKLRNYLLPKLNNDKYKQQMEELSEADDESDDGDNIINDGCNGYNNRRNYYNINNRYTLNNNNNMNHNDEAYVHNNNDYENHNDEEASNDSNSEDKESEDESEDESEGENGDISDVENDDASVNNFNNDNNDDHNNNVDDQDININQNDNNSVASGDGDVDNDDDISVDDDTVNTTNNEDDSSVDTDNDNDDTDDDIVDSSGDDDEASIPKELQNYNAEGSYWSTNDRPSYATVAARSSDGNNESTDVTIGAIILPRTATNQTLGLVSGTET